MAISPFLGGLSDATSACSPASSLYQAGLSDATSACSLASSLYQAGLSSPIEEMRQTRVEMEAALLRERRADARQTRVEMEAALLRERYADQARGMMNNMDIAKRQTRLEMEAALLPMPMSMSNPFIPTYIVDVKPRDKKRNKRLLLC